MINKAYKIRLYPNKTQSELIDKTIGCSRFIYNQMLRERLDVYEKYKGNDVLKNYKYKTEKEYKFEYEFLKEVSSRSLQQSRIDLETAYKNFYRRIRQCKKPGFPKFKSKHKCKWSYREPQVTNQIQIKDNKLKLLKLGWVKFRGLSKSFSGKIKSVTIIKERTGKYCASILVEKEQDIKKRHSNKTTGVDLGLKHYCIDSEGRQVNSINDILFKQESKLKKLQRKFSRQVKGSNRREKTRIRISKIYDKIKNVRNHFHWHLCNLYCSENQTLVLEDLNVSGMVRNKKLSHSISYSGWSFFVSKLKQKALEYGTDVIQVNKFFPSSKTCSNCGNKKEKLGLNERVFVCEKCGFEIDRDLNASLNLKNYGLSRTCNEHGENVRLRELSFNLISSFDEVFTKNMVRDTLL